MSSHWISFPGLGIDAFKVDPVAFSLFGRSIMWYGVIICLGLLLAVIYTWRRFIKEGFTEDQFFNYAIILIPVSVICARLYYVIFDPTPDYHSFLDVIAIWRGGIGIYGGIIGGAIVSIVYAKVIKKPILRVLDCVAPAVMIGQMIGRWGNFVNAEAHGGITDLPWRMGIAPYHENIPYSDDYAVFYHPTFLYESLWNLIGFLIVHFVIAKKKKFEGQIAFFYLAWYGLGRGFIELLRTDSLEIFGFRVSALVGFASALIFGTLYLVRLKKSKDKHDNTEEKAEEEK
ncbi:MAG: prolipoprotein diacylglyceryl transferase [Ruminococcaceae bacterium]|nr:prolipoprotein diacylglyceryl transferase [Oscillospiraceae bacterium]